MAEDAQSVEEAGGGDPVALGAAMAKASPAVDAELVSYLAEQRHHLKSQLRLKLWELRLGVLLRLATVFVGLTIAAGLGFMIWEATTDTGLVIEAFSVPSDLAERGMTGQVVAKQVLDDLANMQADASSSLRPQHYSSNWGDDLKVEIPETGISLSELEAWLHRTLGHQTRIGGEVMRSATGLTVVARSGAGAGERYSGAETDLDGLLQKASESIFHRTQPYNYGLYLDNKGKVAEAAAVFEDLTHSPSPSERAWGYGGLAGTLFERNQVRQADAAARAAVATDPNSLEGWGTVEDVDDIAGHAEDELAAARRRLELLKGPAANAYASEAIPLVQQYTTGIVDALLGDHTDQYRRLEQSYPTLDLSAEPAAQIKAIKSTPGGGGIGTRNYFAAVKTRDHDFADEKRLLTQEPAFMATITDASERPGAIWAFRSRELEMAYQLEDWPKVRQLDAIMDAAVANTHYAALSPALWPIMAYAEAKMGDFAAAHALIDRISRDNYHGLDVRGKIDAAEKNYGGAAFWFAEAVRQAPSIPFAYVDWGQMQLERGDAAGAAQKFQQASQKGPHYADAWEGWGEALMAQNRSDLALAKFAEAEKYAPNWGRLHLKWGEALNYAGKKDEAKKQFAAAATHDLTAAEKKELGRIAP